MEAVRAFNNELSSLYEVKPPISRAKMATVTKTAIKAIKYYKHVVQSIEKFIQKCKPEYKVPGLYVIDSVVRQSRHQFGSNKDMFAPRFTKNIIVTFQNLFKCPGEERSKIVRVLNLWQKNEVFPSEIIQPLLDLAADPTKPSTIAAAQSSVDGWLAANGKPSQPSSQPPSQSQHQSSNHEEQMSQSAAESMLATQNDMLNTVTQLLQHTNSSNTSLSAQQQQLQHLQFLQQQLVQQTQLMQQPTGTGPIIDPNLLAQIQTLTNQLLSKTEPKPEEGFNKKLLDFDYGESDEEEEKKPPQPAQNDGNVTGSVQNILNDPSLMQQIHQVSQSIQKNEEMQSEIDEEKRRVLEQQQAEFDQQIALGMPPHQAHHQSHHQVQQQQQQHTQHQTHNQPPHQPHHQPMPFEQPPPMPEPVYREEGEYEEEPNDDDFRDHHQLKDRDEREGRRDRRRRSRSRSRSPKRRKRTRSKSRERRRRSRSRSRSRHKRSRSKDKEREKQKEKERERKRKCLPPLKERQVAICTTTIWIGHLNKFTQEDELRTELERYGTVQTINMVPPRGCAYIVMKERKDAARAIDRLKGYRLNGSALKTAWAQSSGIRESDFKDGWDVDIGTMYVPWDRLPSDLSPLLEGAIIDSDSLPEKMKDIPTEKSAIQPVETPDVSSSQALDQASTQPQMPAQAPVMGMMQQGMPHQMSGILPGMMMSMQRPMDPNMAAQTLGMGPRPPQIIAGAVRPQTPQLPGARPAGAAIASMSIASTTASTIAQTIQNMLPTTAGLVQGSPGQAPRPMGFPPRFGFNPNMPPPGFRMPPPGFPPHMRMRMPGKPPAPDGSDKPDEVPNPDGPPREMIWPPDSNEKDEDDMDDEEQDGDKEKEIEKGAENEPPPGFPPMQDHPFNMMGPLPPGGFPPGGPPGPPNAPWNMGPNMRMGGPGPMRFPMGMMPPEMFNGPRGPMMGGPMPPFMGPGFPRFPPGMGPGPRPVSLLDLEIKPPPKFSEKNENMDEEEEEGGYDNNEEEEEGGGAEEEEEGGMENEQEVNQEDKADVNEEGEGQAAEEEEDDPRNSYPFNTWQTVAPRKREVKKIEDQEQKEEKEERDTSRHRSWDEDDGRNRRDRERGDRERGDRDRGDRDRGDRGDRNRDRDRGDREWGRDRDREWGRDRDRERDWRRDDRRDRRDDNRRDDRRDRDRDRDRGRDSDRPRRQRKSRWGDPLETTGEDAGPPVLEREWGYPENPNEGEVENSGKDMDVPEENTSEQMSTNVNESEYNQFDGGEGIKEVTESGMEMGESFKETNEDQYEGNVNGENDTVNEIENESGPPPLVEEPAFYDPVPTTNGPESIEDMSSVVPNKLDVIQASSDVGDAEFPQENSGQTDSNMPDLEEGELDS